MKKSKIFTYVIISILVCTLCSCLTLINIEPIWLVNNELSNKAKTGDILTFEGRLEPDDSIDGELSCLWFTYRIKNDIYIYKDLTTTNTKIVKGRIKISFTVDKNNETENFSYPLECSLYIITRNGREYNSNNLPIIYLYK